MTTRLIIITFAALLISCAKQTSPTGGPKDETPPKLLSTTPPDQSVNFKADEVELEFDEYVQLNNPREQLIITPSINKQFEVSVKKKKVILKFKEPLQENTTYSINFREAVQDLNEKNPAVNLKVAYSTGTYIDSLEIDGVVTDLLKNTPLKDQTVGLVLLSDTTDIFKYPTQWLTVTDKEGKFHMENLKPGTYQFYAFNDKNKNLIVDSKLESFGFIPGSIKLDSSLHETKIATVRLDVRNPTLISARPISTYFNIKFNKGMKNFHITDSLQQKAFINTADGGATLKIYNTFPGSDSVLLHINSTDSLDNMIDTTLYAKFNLDQSSRKDKATGAIPTSVYTVSNSTFTAKLTFNKPVTYFNPDSIYIELDSVNRLVPDKNSYSFNDEQTIMDISQKIEKEILIQEAPKDDKFSETSLMSAKSATPKNKMNLKTGHAAFITVENDTLPPMEQSLRIITPQETAILHYTVQTEQPFIIQLLDNKFQVVREIKNNKQSSFENVPASTYYLRLVIDQNNNGKWDLGNYYNNKAPEPVVFFTSEKGQSQIDLKANWEVGPLLITY